MQDQPEVVEPKVNQLKVQARFQNSGEFSFKEKYNNASILSGSPKKKGSANYFRQSNPEKEGPPNKVKISD
eukprot:CAMPEP_0202964008 /NCGR_PEP_ID=MMETSP1396-20130829/8072_1 /ASSEMBLY_ACC=CAM_ASM_000872 /TAXON_ID= /ORGANISM="Pseudokeronopsis sp., Strain Brazil" /LENGTH=70 /DNA_ID=CAMNT_0049685747 /DNA_START=279 /DNA_END=491 /DNA_ORIENTATION=+